MYTHLYMHIYVNMFRYVYIYVYLNFDQIGDISTLNGGSLKLVDKFTNLGRRVSSTENDIRRG